MISNKQKHLEFIHGIINRMAHNSFALKGWAVTLVAGIFALAAKDADKMYFLVTYIPIIVFWCLDAFYLKQERLYRSLYEHVRRLEEEDIDYSMNTSISQCKSSKNTWINCFVSKTEMGFYLPLAFVATGIIILTSLLG